LPIIKVLLPTDAQENCFKRSIKICINKQFSCASVGNKTLIISRWTVRLQKKLPSLN